MDKRRARVEELEPRVLLSGELAGAFALPPTYELDDPTQVVVESVAPIVQHRAARELVIIDTGIDDWESLLEDVIGQSSGERSIDVLVLDADRDGLSQIAEALSGYANDLDVIHLVSHGSSEGIQLGATWLDRAELASRAEIISGWGDALSQDADLLVYGCNLAASSEGKELIAALGLLTGADVAASEDTTGASALGGDWELEHTTGSIEAFVVFTARVQEGFGTVLAGTAIWADKATDTPQTSEFDGSSFAAETDTSPVGSWSVISGAEAPTRDEKIVLGTDGNGTLTGQIWDGGSWSVLPGVTAPLNSEEWGFDVAYSSKSGDALMVWGDEAGGGMFFATWDGTTFSGPIAFTGPIPGEPVHLKLAADPNSDQIMLVGSVPGVLSDFAMVWDGTAFVASRTFAMGSSSLFATDISVVYEVQSGNAMVVYGADGVVHYAVYDGASWSSGFVAKAADNVDEVIWTSITADPNSNRIALIAATDGQDIFLSIWDGTSWDSPVTAPSGLSHSQRQGVAIAFESKSGQVVAAYAADALNLVYQTWTAGAGWSGELTGPSLGEHIDTLTLDADPNTDTVMLSIVEHDDVVSFLVWNGTSFGSLNTLEVDAGTSSGQPFLFLWENDDTPNTAPVLTPGTPSLPSITEDELVNKGDVISSLLGSSISDLDKGALEGIAITTLVSSNGTWEYSTDGGTSWTAVGTVSDSSALLLRDSDHVRFVPDGQNLDDARFEFRAWDRTSGTEGNKVDVSTNGGTTAYSAATDSASIAVSAVNDAPTLNPSAPSLTSISEDDPDSAGDLISNLLANVTDVDAIALEGIAVTSLTSGSGVWEYSIDAGSNWNAVGTVSGSSALLLRDIDRMRFVPGGEVAEVASFDFRVWDQSSETLGNKVDVSVNGGATPFSAASDTASITITAVNDAPVLDASGSMTLTNVVEDDVDPPGDSITSIILSAGSDRITDVDPGSSEGLAIINVDDSNGSWEYSLDGGSNWSGFGSVSNGSAVLLNETARIRFVPNASYTGSAGDIVFRAWDQTSGSNGDTGFDAAANGGTTAISIVSDTATLTIIATNDAPVLIPSAPTLSTITEDDTGNAGALVSTIVGSSISDLDGAALEGIAITSLTSGNGRWEYSVDAGSSWNEVPTPISNTAALLLRDIDRVRFVPDGQNADAASFVFRGWDQTSGVAGTQVDASTNGGTAAYSLATDTASIVVTAVNDAPILDNTGSMTLTDIAESVSSPAGNTVANIISSAGGDRIIDVDTGDPEGVAIVAVDNSNGSWQFSTNGGGIWTAFGTVSDSAAVLLDTGDLIRFVPAIAHVGTAGDIQFRAWDQSAGSSGQTGVDTTTNGLATPFSAQTETASLNVFSQNYAPVLTPFAPSLTAINEDDSANSGDLVSSLLGGSISDLNASALEGVAITSLSSGNGSWSYSTNAGASWAAVGTVSNSSALLLRDIDRVRFVPDGLNADSATFDFRAWDQATGTVGTKVDVSTNGGATAFSTATDTASIAVSAVNDAPTLGHGTLASVASNDTNPPGETIANLFGDGYSDVDSGSRFSGMAVISNTADANSEGEWQYSSDGGSNWSAIGSVGDDGSALVLATGTRVRFVSVAGFSGATEFAGRGLDDRYAGTYSSTAAGSESRATVDASSNGGTSAIAAGTSKLSTTVLFVAPPVEVSEDPDPPETPAESTELTPEEDPIESTDSEDPSADGEPDVIPENTESSSSSSQAAPLSESLPIGVAAVAPVVADPASEPLRDDDVEKSERETVARKALDVLRDVYLGNSSISADFLIDLIFNGRRDSFLGELDEVQEEMQALGELEFKIVSSSVAVTSGLSVGYVLWMTRGGLLIASLLSSLPAWRLIDPIPILSRIGPDEEGVDDENDEAESLDSMVNSEPDDEDLEEEDLEEEEPGELES